MTTLPLLSDTTDWCALPLDTRHTETANQKAHGDSGYDFGYVEHAEAGSDWCATKYGNYSEYAACDYPEPKEEIPMTTQLTSEELEIVKRYRECHEAAIISKHSTDLLIAIIDRLDRAYDAILRSTYPVPHAAPTTANALRRRVTCDRCGGKRTFKCTVCNGEGHMSFSDDGIDRDCYACHGDGVIDCLQCKDSGKMDAPAPRSDVAVPSEPTGDGAGDWFNVGERVRHYSGVNAGTITSIEDDMVAIRRDATSDVVWSSVVAITHLYDLPAPATVPTAKAVRKPTKAQREVLIAFRDNKSFHHKAIVIYNCRDLGWLEPNPNFGLGENRSMRITDAGRAALSASSLRLDATIAPSSTNSKESTMVKLTPKRRELLARIKSADGFLGYVNLSSSETTMVKWLEENKLIVFQYDHGYKAMSITPDGEAALSS